MTPEQLETGAAVLAASDPILASIIERVGPCSLQPDRDPFTALARAIVGQQVSVHAAAAIWSRFMHAAGENGATTPESVISAEFDALRAAGLSGPKARYVRDLATKFADGTIDPGSLPAMDDEEIIAHLTQVKGVGRWTAEMFLIFSLGRPDVLPVDDLGLLNAVQRAYGLDRRPSTDEARRRGEAWRPWRSLATWYLWQSLRLVPLPPSDID